MQHRGVEAPEDMCLIIPKCALQATDVYPKDSDQKHKQPRLQMTRAEVGSAYAAS